MKQQAVVSSSLVCPKRILILCLFCIFMLVGCVGGGDTNSNNGNSDSQDATLYQQALASYQAGNYSQALIEFQSLFSRYPTSIYADNAQYYTARCHHEMLQFAVARNEYNTFLVEYPASNYVDNTVFYLGRTYFDEAALQTDSQLEFTLLATAVSSLADFIAAYPGSTIVDAGQYYLGRSYHSQAVLVQLDSTLSADTASQLFINARTYYEAIASSSVYKDNAQYFKAQTYHDQADFVSARVEYQTLINWAGSNWADDAKYQYAKTYYDQALLTTPDSEAFILFDTAITQFDSMLTDMLYQTSNQWEAALYFKGRSYQRQGDLIVTNSGLGDLAVKYADARTVFQSLVNQRPSSVWADNALYQIGITDYDEAKVAEVNADYVTMSAKLSDAIDAFNLVLSDPLYKTSNSADNAQYNLGRSYQTVLSMPANERGAVFATVTYDTVRAAYNMLISEYPASSWVDNAYYEIGNTYYSEANDAADNPVKEAAFNNALGRYYTVVTDYPDSIRYDNAVYKIAWIYHYAENCALELQWFNYHAGLSNVSASEAIIRDSHITDLSLAAPTAHVCPTPPTLMVSGLSTP